MFIRTIILLIACQAAHASQASPNPSEGGEEGRKVVIITKAQATQLAGEKFASDSFFNPIQDSLGRWVISKEEVEQCKENDVKKLIEKLPLVEFKKHREADNYFLKNTQK